MFFFCLITLKKKFSFVGVQRLFIFIFSRPGQSHGLLYKYPCHLLIHYFTDPLVPTALQCRYTQTVGDKPSGYKVDSVIVIKKFLNPEGHQNPISGSKVTAVLLKGWILPIGGASAGEGLRLQPAQQACSSYKHFYWFHPNPFIEGL